MWVAVIACPLGDQLDQSDIVESPQSKRIATLSCSGSVAAAEKV
jgi:hypothetical protein